MKRLIVTIALLLGTAIGQSYPFHLNNDLNTHGYTMPLPCPSTTSANCSGAQALNGANSVWAECDFSRNSGLVNPECGSNTQVAPIVPGNTANPAYVHIVRATDAAMMGAPTAWSTNPSGAWGDGAWEASATRMVLDTTSPVAVFAFDPNPASATYLKVTKLYRSGYTINSRTSWFSRQPPPYPGGRTVSYWFAVMLAQNVPGYPAGSFSGVAAHDLVLTRWDFSSVTTAPSASNGTIALVKDFSTAGCLGARFDLSAAGARPPSSVLSASYDDQTFFVAMANPGCQTTDSCSNYNNMITFNIAKASTGDRSGCAVLRPDLGTVKGFDGVTRNLLVNGTLNITFNAQGMNGFQTGGLAYVEAQTGSSSPNGGPGNTFERWTWETGVPYPGNAHPPGTTLWVTGTDDGGGHNTEGWSHEVNVIPIDISGQSETWMRAANNGTVDQLDPQTLAMPGTKNCYVPYSKAEAWCPLPDAHMAWLNNIDGTDTAPFVDAPYTQEALSAKSPLPYTPQWPWTDEIQLYPVTCYPSCTSANRPWRVVHSYTNQDLAQFHPSYYSEFVLSGAVSSRPVYGQFFILWTSNWAGQLGCASGAYSKSSPLGYDCVQTGGVGNRFDVFIAAVPD